jgi:hypothetical protein
LEVFQGGITALPVARDLDNARAHSRKILRCDLSNAGCRTGDNHHLALHVLVHMQFS